MIIIIIKDKATSEVVRMASWSKQSTASVGESATAWNRLEMLERGGGERILSRVEAGKPPSRDQSFKGGGLRAPPHSTRMDTTLGLPATALISLKIGEEEVMVRLEEAVMMAVKEEKEVGPAFDIWIGAKAEVLTIAGRGRLGRIARARPGWLFHLWQG